MIMYIFNPEHDLCIANGDPNFVPPASALQFGKDCADILPLVFGDDGPVVWGWNPVLKQRLLKQGIAKELLPDDAQLRTIRELSHRRYALDAAGFVYSGSSDYDFIAEPVGKELYKESEVEDYLEKYGDVVLKAPWSGSGKGLRWVNVQSATVSDRGWWHNVILRQGSVVAERRECVQVDFASLFYITENEVSFIGFSLFNTSNGAYNSSILASDDYILSYLSDYIPSNIINNSVDLLKTFLTENFLGKYSGPVGVDMFVSRAQSQHKFLLHPCVEINVRMTMGLVARRLFDRFLYGKSVDGKYLMKVFYNKDNESLKRDLAIADSILTGVDNRTSYAIAIVDNLQ